MRPRREQDAKIDRRRRRPARARCRCHHSTVAGGREKTLAARRPQTTGATGEEDLRRGLATTRDIYQATRDTRERSLLLPATYVPTPEDSTPRETYTSPGPDTTGFPVHHRETRPHGPNNLTSLLLSSESGHRFWNRRPGMLFHHKDLRSSCCYKGFNSSPQILGGGEAESDLNGLYTIHSATSVTSVHVAARLDPQFSWGVLPTALMAAMNLYVLRAIYNELNWVGQHCSTRVVVQTGCC